MLRGLISTWPGWASTGLTLGIAAVVWALIHAPLPSVGTIVGLVLLGEALLMFFAARRTLAPFRQRLDGRQMSLSEAEPGLLPFDPLAFNTRWLWNALPATLVGLLLLFLVVALV